LAARFGSNCIDHNDMIKHGKHKGKSLEYVIKIDPNYALHAHATYSWFPKLNQSQIIDCGNRYRYLPRRDWSTYDFHDYGDGWC